MAEIVFVTLFLGLVSGVHPLELRAGPAVQSIRVTLGAREIANFTQPPWRTTIDFGTKLEPGELVAVGYDANGREIGRASQTINLPKPFADVAIVVKRDGETPVAVQVVPRHLQFAMARSATVSVDGKPLPVDKFTARLPRLDWMKPHVIAAEVKFVDNMVARREIAVTGGSYTSEAEMTPVLVTGGGEDIGGCFSLDGAALHASAVERPPAIVVVVKDPDTAEAHARLEMMAPNFMERRSLRRDLTLNDDTTEQIIWPTAQRFAQGAEESNLFGWGGDAHTDFLSLFFQRPEGREWIRQPRRFADAVAVAALSLLKTPSRRAVVLLAGGERDMSVYAAAEVRHYLQSVGVPLFVWSLSGPRPDLADTWGKVVDISDRDKFHDAVVRLRGTLDAQRIVWLPVSRVEALRVRSNCGAAPVAH